MNDNSFFGFIPSNTFTSTSFDLLKDDNNIADSFIDISAIANNSLDESYFAMAVDFIKESNKQFTDCKMNLYKSISEATTEAVVLESFSDFFVQVAEVIDKFSKFIIAINDKALATITSYIKDDKTIKRHENGYKSFKGTVSIEGYKYTFDPNIPMANASVYFNQNLFEDLYKRTGDILTVDDMKDVMAAANYEEDYNKFRGAVIGKSSISGSQFGMELFKIFRNGESDISNIEFSSTEVYDIYKRFKDYKKTLDETRANLRNIIKDYENIKSSVKSISNRNGDLNKSAFIKLLPGDKVKDIKTNGEDYITPDVMYQIDLYTKAKVCQIIEYSNIHTLAFSAKLDALKESFRQDRSVLYTALSKMEVSK